MIVLSLNIIHYTSNKQKNPKCDVYEKEKVSNDTITLEFARGLVVENNGVSLNLVAYALTTHKKWVYLQVGRDIKRTISQLATISKQGKGVP
jgi:hypothetical protein